MNKIVLMFLLFATSVSAQNFFVEGDIYQGQPIICRFQKDATELAEAYVHDGVEEFVKIYNKKNEEHLCAAGVQIAFTIIKEMSVHKDKETVYVIEVRSGEVHYIVAGRQVIKLSKKFIEV